MSETQESPIRIDLERAESWKCVAHVSVDQSHMEGLRDSAAEKLRGQVKMDGFRPGKVPIKIVRAQLASEVEREALESLVPIAYRQVMQENDDVHPVTEPSVENLDLPEDEPVSFDLVIEVRPDLEITGLEALKGTRVLPPVTDERVDEALANLAERQAEWQEKTEGHAADDDALLIDTCPLDDNGERVEDEGESDQAVLLGSDQLLPEFNAALVGLQAGESTDVEVNYPVDFPVEDLRGTTRKIHVDLKEVREKKLPALDDEFAKANSRFETLDEMRVDVREQLAQGMKRESDRHLREQLIDGLLATNEIPVLPSLEARYLQGMVADMERQSGQELEDEQRQQLSEAYKPVAQRAVRKMILLDNLRRNNDIQVSEEEFEARIAELAAEQGTEPERFRALVERAGNLERLRGEMDEDKVFALIEEKAQITVTEKMPEAEAQGAEEAEAKE